MHADWDADEHHHRQDLTLLLSQLPDAALLDHLRAGRLSEAGYALAVAEAQRRDLPLPDPAAEPPSVLALSDEPYLGDWTLLERNLTPTEAHLLSACLQSAGLQAEAGDVNMVQANALLSVAVGGASVRVPQAQLAEAQAVLAAFRRGEFTLGDDFDPRQTGVAD
jgi:hypothetical protein